MRDGQRVDGTELPDLRSLEGVRRLERLRRAASALNRVGFGGRDAGELRLLEQLAAEAERHDDITAKHVRRVGRIAAAIADRLGSDPAEVHRIRRTAPLHDIGKLGLPAEVLRMPDKGTPQDVALRRQHTIMGAYALMPADTPMLTTAAVIALYHHERWDGQGYPHALTHEGIPLAARIVAVADVYDALTHSRPYKLAWSVDRALDEIRSERGHHFDPGIVDAFCACVREGVISALAAD